LHLAVAETGRRQKTAQQKNKTGHPTKTQQITEKAPARRKI